MSFKLLLEDKLKSIGQDYKVTGNEIVTRCLNPNHIDGKPSYSINWTNGVSHCFSCGYAPHPAVLIDGDEEEVEELLRQAQYNYYKEQLNEGIENTDTHSFTLPPKDYNVNKDWRGVSQSLLEVLGVYYCSKGRFAGRLVFPILKGSEVLGFDARIVNPTIVPDKLKDVKWIRPKGMPAQTITYPYDYLKELDCTHLVLTEGVMDCVSYLELGVPAIPTFGVAPPDDKRITQMLELGVKTVSIGYDNDDAGRTATMKVFPYYAEWFEIKNNLTTFKVFKSGEKDCNDYLMKIKGLK